MQKIVAKLSFDQAMMTAATHMHDCLWSLECISGASSQVGKNASQCVSLLWHVNSSYVCIGGRIDEQCGCINMEGQV